MDRRAFIIAILCSVRRLDASAAERLCSLCGEAIPAGTKYYKRNDGPEIYCERCFLEAPRCSVCNLPVHAEDIDPETGACPPCLAALPRCRACGKPIVGTAYQLRFGSGVFCPRCKETRPACYVCGAPVGDDYWKYPDGRITCGECGERVVVDFEEIRRILREVQSIVGRRLNLKTRKPFALTIEKLSGLEPVNRRLVAQDPAPAAALFGRELGQFRSINGQSEIVLLFGLPPEWTYEAAAHEYAHAWQAENGVLRVEEELKEGFAQWVAADVLRAKNFKTALEKLEARTDFPYGTGYQRLKSMRNRAVLNLMLQKR